MVNDQLISWPLNHVHHTLEIWRPCLATSSVKGIRRLSSTRNIGVNFQWKCQMKLDYYSKDNINIINTNERAGNWLYLFGLYIYASNYIIVRMIYYYYSQYFIQLLWLLLFSFGNDVFCNFVESNFPW